MSYKVNHYAKPVDVGFTISWESVFIELCIGIVSCIMGYAGWQSQLALLAFPCAFVGLTCFGLVIFQLLMYFKEKRQKRVTPKQNNEQSSS